jgi:hypothetical protein
MLLKENTYIVVGTLEWKWDIGNRFMLDGKNFYMCSVFQIVFYSFVQLPKCCDGWEYTIHFIYI